MVGLFNSNDPRITDNPYRTAKCIELSDVAGYFKYSDDMGGIATFYNGDTNQPVFTVAREITPELRVNKNKNHGDDCTCDTTPWNELIYSCGCAHHHDGEISSTSSHASRLAASTSATGSTPTCSDSVKSVSRLRFWMNWRARNRRI